jgi:hypothetical protein
MIAEHFSSTSGPSMGAFAGSSRNHQQNYALNNENAQETRIKRVKAKTLDDTQGDEADFVFVDYTATSHPGFTTAPFHSRPN